ncbi:MAG: FecR family protein [Niastella sp.]|uniref:FecR family protein n=1 Tax=Niastella sp. TaxID=1869183 RepID=UPI00389A17E4
MDANQFSDLLQRYRLGTCSEEEKERVEGWYNERRNDLYNPLTETEEEMVGARIYSNVQDVLTAATAERVIPIWRKKRTRWVAAATMILMATAGYFLLTHKDPVPGIVHTLKPETRPVMPGGNKALLTLGDGSVIVLDSAANGALSQQGKTIVLKKQDGQLIYQSRHNGNQEAVAWNTISTPRGGQYQVVLPDGTKVWLNAVSSLRFPAGFTGKERVVELTGEAYFEVSHNNQPFIVEIISAAGKPGGNSVEVLGTHFNIKAYDDEPAIKTTLLEGAVKVTKDAASVLLKPGEQTSISQSSQPSQPIPVQTEEVVAWKDGRFVFSEAGVETVMREIARWYDVEIVYAGKVPAENFEGEIPRNSNIQEVFKILELSNVHCKIEGRKITVLP